MQMFVQWAEDQFQMARCTRGHWLRCLTAATVRWRCRYWRTSRP